MNENNKAAYKCGKRDRYIAALKLMKDLLRKELCNDNEFDKGICIALDIVREQLFYAIQYD